MASSGAERVLTVPNLLSAARLLLAPIFLGLYVRGDGARAVMVFAAAAVTDVLDGLAARLLDQRSRVGVVLDPIADKALALSALFALAARGRLPMWLPLLEVSRDAAQLAATWWLRAHRRPLPGGPTHIAKYATFGLAATVLLALSEEVGIPREALAPWVAAMGLLSAVCIAVSWAQYFAFFLRSARGGEAAPESR